MEIELGKPKVILAWNNIETSTHLNPNAQFLLIQRAEKLKLYIADCSSPEFSNKIYDLVNSKKNCYGLDGVTMRLEAVLQLLCYGVSQEIVLSSAERDDLGATLYIVQYKL